MNYPRNKEEWWQFVDDHKENLLKMIEGYHPSGQRNGPKMTITAPRAEEVTELFRKEIAGQADPAERFAKAVTDRNGQVVHSILNETWFGIPESMDAHSLPSFGVLCDLCSEYEGY